jgi:hypothetical protein
MLMTTALAGGSRYRPTTSRTLATRWGWMPHLRQIRATDANEMPSSAPRNRADQCVIPSRSGGRPSLASVATTTSISSITAGRPERGSSSSALIPPAAYLSRPPITVGRDTPTVRAIRAFGIPSAASSTIRARFARPDGTLGSRVRSPSLLRSPSRRLSAGANDMLHCPTNHTVKQLPTRDTSGSKAIRLRWR